MCLAAAQHIIDEKRYAELDIPEAAIPMIEWAWNNEPPAIYGRFDISWSGFEPGAKSGPPPKLLEYNADTPTSLLEAAVVQWHWLKDMPASLVSSRPDQFNSIHEKLIAKWKDVDDYLSKPVYFAALENANNPEDQLTVTYLRDTAQQAGLETRQLAMADIGWDSQHQTFVDLDDHPIFSIFKLYPWEAMLQEDFGVHALETYTAVRWIEPIWKMLLSNKGILPILWQLYPNHDLLLEAHFAPTKERHNQHEKLRPQTLDLPRRREHHPHPRQRHCRLHRRSLPGSPDYPGPRARRHLRSPPHRPWLMDDRSGLLWHGRPRILQPHHRQPKLLRPPLLHLKRNPRAEQREAPGLPALPRPVHKSRSDRLTRSEPVRQDMLLNPP